MTTNQVNCQSLSLNERQTILNRFNTNALSLAEYEINLDTNSLNKSDFESWTANRLAVLNDFSLIKQFLKL